MRAPGPSTVHKALNNMTSDERVNTYIELNNIPPTDIDDLKQLNAFNTKMKQNFAEDVATAEQRMIYLKDPFYNPPYELGDRTIADILRDKYPETNDQPTEVSTSTVSGIPLVIRGTVIKRGGKTRRNRRGRVRGRRSLKHKHSKRRR